jgi:ribosomal protein S18 acetylase RimI-like enzyme
MASTDVLQFARLSEDDIGGCMALSAEAGWNQTPDDWIIFLRRGTVFGVRGADGAPVASGAILPYSDAFAWTSMVLVTASRRRARIGTRLLEECCAALKRRGLVAVLDATPAGERVYRPLGFEPMFALSRWQGQGGGRAALVDGIRAMTEGDLATVSAIDTAVFGAPRMFLLESLFRRAPQLAFITQDGGGFVLARPGRIATQVGPIVAADQDAAAALLELALDAVSGPVLLDVCDRWAKLAGVLQRRHFTIQRPYLRMGLKRRVPFGDPGRTFVVAGPEFG